MTTLRLITAAAYIEQELSAEFGQLPPAFLPAGVSRLYEAQAERFAARHLTYLTIPESFTPQAQDARRLAELGVVLLPVPEGLKLGESIVYALNYIGGAYQSVQILHGDTLIEGISDELTDILAVHSEGDDYSWAAATLNGEKIVDLTVIPAGTNHQNDRPVVCGFFAFSSISLLIRSITRERGNFIAGLNRYNAERTLKACYVKAWYDFGHIQTYFRSRRSINTARSFNDLQIDRLTVRKSSTDVGKLSAEAAWLRDVPPKVRPYCARLIDAGWAETEYYYVTEYQYAPTLAELFVFSSIGRSTWQNILQSCADFLFACSQSHGPGSADAALSELCINKTFSRLERYATESGFDINRENRLFGRSLPSLTRIAEDVGASLNLSTGRKETVMHGDFCFSNILYNSRAGRIAVIDPRGTVYTGQQSCYGDPRYDLAKFSHSVYGYYDLILAGRYSLTNSSPNDFSFEVESTATHTWLQSALADLKVGDFAANGDEIKCLTICLFLSMLPLHADRPDRQAAFVATALRLYADIEGVV